jgi:hypothetical protein
MRQRTLDRGWWVIATASVVTGLVLAVWVTDYLVPPTPPPLDAETARAAILKTYRQYFGPDTYPVQELESAPL